MIRHREFDVSEMTLASYCAMRARGDAPFTAIPVFLARTFVHSGLFGNTKCGVREPADLKGKRVGPGQFLMSFAVWARGLLHEDYGLDLSSVDWRTGRARGADRPGAGDEARSSRTGRCSPTASRPARSTP